MKGGRTCGEENVGDENTRKKEKRETKEDVVHGSDWSIREGCNEHECVERDNPLWRPMIGEAERKT